MKTQESDKDLQTGVFGWPRITAIGARAQILTRPCAKWLGQVTNSTGNTVSYS